MAFNYIIVILVLSAIVNIEAGKDKNKKKDDLILISKSKEDMQMYLYTSIQKCFTQLSVQITDKKAMEKNEHCLTFCIGKEFVFAGGMNMDSINNFAKNNLTEASQGTFLNVTNACLAKKGVTADKLSKQSTDLTEANCKAWTPTMKCIKKGIKKASKAVAGTTENPSGSSTATPQANNNKASNNDDDDDDDDN